MLVGRGRELETLERMLEASRTGRGTVRLVAGEAGIGKTRLADETAARAASLGFVVAWGRAWETGGAPAYWPWIEAIGVIDEALPPEDATGAQGSTLLRDRHAAFEGQRSDPARERFELFEAVGAYLRASARRAPLLLVLDDIHVADVSSLELLAFVARGIRASRIAVLATYRDVEARLPPVADPIARVAREGDVVALRRLSREEVAEIVRHELGRYDAALADRLFALTEGNPLFVRETLLACRDAMQDGRGDVVVAGGVTALVRARLAGAADATRNALEVASALGRTGTHAALAEVAGVAAEDAAHAIGDAAARGLLTTRGEGWSVSHVLVREAFYCGLPPERRRTLHAAAARWFRSLVERGEEHYLATLAHHALEGISAEDPPGATDARREARRAADRARGQLAYEDAIALLDRALATCAEGTDAPERVEMLLALGWACTEAGRLDRGRDAFREAAVLARKIGDARLFARAALGQGGEFVLAEIRGELLDVLREALARLEGHDERTDVRLRARLLARLAAALTPSSNPEEPLGLARQALAMLEDETDARTRIEVAVSAGAAFTDFALPSERIPLNERLLRDARDAGDRVLELRALTRLSCEYLERGDVASADAAIAARAALSASLAHPRYAWQTPLLASMRAMVDGRWADSDRHVAEALRISGEALDPNAARCIAIHRFSLAVVAGRTAELRARAAEAIVPVNALPDGSALRSWILALASAHLGDRANAATAFAAVGPGSAVKARMIRVTMAEAAALIGDRAWCASLHDSLVDEADIVATWGPFAFACATPTARALAATAFVLGRTDEAIAHCEAALAMARAMEARAHEAWVHMTWGCGLAASGRDAGAAREHLEAAIALGEELEMPAVLERARASLVTATATTATTASGERRPSGAPASAFSIERAGSGWSVTHAGTTFELKDVRGLAMLAQLVASPGREIHALDLASDPGTAGATGAAIDLGDSGEVLDARARDAYRRRIADLRAELDEATSFADPGRVELAQRELDALTEQLAAAVGLGGRERRTGSAAERARITVQRRVREAIKKIAERDPDLGRHLDWTVRTGTFCAYEPEGRKTRRS